jgi:hypothetical protein
VSSPGGALVTLATTAWACACACGGTIRYESNARRVVMSLRGLVLVLLLALCLCHTGNVAAPSMFMSDHGSCQLMVWPQRTSHCYFVTLIC